MDDRKLHKGILKVSYSCLEALLKLPKNCEIVAVQDGLSDNNKFSTDGFRLKLRYYKLPRVEEGNVIPYYSMEAIKDGK